MSQERVCFSGSCKGRTVHVRLKADPIANSWKETCADCGFFFGYAMPKNHGTNHLVVRGVKMGYEPAQPIPGVCDPYPREREKRRLTREEEIAIAKRVRALHKRVMEMDASGDVWDPDVELPRPVERKG